MIEYIVTLFIIGNIIYVYIKFKKTMKDFKTSAEKDYKNNKLFYQKKYKEAIEIYQSRIKEAPMERENYLYIAFSYYYIGEFRKAINNFIRLINLSDNSSLGLDIIYPYLINSYIELEDIKKAKELFYEYDKNYYSAEKRFKRKSRDKDKKYLENKAWFLFNEGKTKEAIKLYDKSLLLWEKYFKKEGKEKEEEIDYTDLFYHFGIISKHKGEYEKALEYFKKSIKAGGPESIFTKRSEEEIKRIKEMRDKEELK